MIKTYKELSTSLIIREIKIKAKMKYHITHKGMIITQKTINKREIQREGSIIC